jgi:hypothetical protein
LYVNGIIALGLQNGRNHQTGGAEAGHLAEHVHDRFGGETRNGGAAEVLDPADEPGGEGRLEMPRLTQEKVWPARIMGRDVNILADCPLDALLKTGHFPLVPRLPCSDAQGLPWDSVPFMARC